MTIDEAIKILTPMSDGRNLYPKLSERDAIKLGIEALKRVGSYRHFPDTKPGSLLPGETKG